MSPGQIVIRLFGWSQKQFRAEGYLPGSACNVIIAENHAVNHPERIMCPECLQTHLESCRRPLD